jgi:hypothetical protein
MLLQKAKLENGQLVITESKEIDQGKLTSDCWLIQINGLAACKGCEYLNKRHCGGKAIRKALLNNELKT